MCSFGEFFFFYSNSCSVPHRYYRCVVTLYSQDGLSVDLETVLKIDLIHLVLYMSVRLAGLL